MSATAVTTQEEAVPLCVDLDGTLIKTDLLWESLLRLLKENPLYLFLLPLWLMKGRACLKQQIAFRVASEHFALPYSASFVEFLQGEQRRGRRIILATASNGPLAQRATGHLGLFAEVLGSDGETNLRGAQKVLLLAQRFGARGFDYAGNSSVDLAVWRQAREAIVVNADGRLVERAREVAKVTRVFNPPRATLRAMLQALRPHQWVKNLIIFVPLLTSHQILKWPLPSAAVLAFLAFSLCASAVYVLNDLLDLEADRHHATKNSRPFAAGDLSLPAGFAIIVILLATSASLAWSLSWSFLGVLATYLVVTTGYSWRWKQVPLLDVFFLAGLYTLRLIAGHEATGIVYSTWLLMFSMFLFLSLALMKRFVELHGLRQEKNHESKGRGYTADDLELVAMLGAASGYLSVLIFALYVNSSEVRMLYQRPTLLLLVCPLLLYWISRVWMLAHRGQMHDDPIVFALKDRASYLTGAITLGVLWLATGG